MIGKIAWRNIWFKPLNTILSLLLLTASVTIMTVIILLQKQFEDQFNKNMDNVDLIIGAKGSPLQLVLSALYQIDAPPGNISLEEATPYMHHPFVEKAIPMAYGDNYNGFNIVGTTEDYIQKFDAKIEKGNKITNTYDVVIGYDVAQKANLKIGQEFFGSHGDADGEVHKHHAYKVVGILNKTNRLIDNIIICNIDAVWAMHQEEPHAHHNEHNDGHDHEHDHETDVDHDPKEITAVILKLRNQMAKLNWQRMIPQNTNMQAASPILEINRLFGLFGIGIQALQYLAYGIMLISGISIFVALYNTLKNRKYEFALLRIQGAGKWQLFTMILAESIFLCIVGYLLGMILGRVAIYALSYATQAEFKLTFNPWMYIWDKELTLMALCLVIGMIAAIIPAIKAYSINISKTLAHA